ncbi:hypothetical protein EVAR_67943_1 [Eumeta japonica]|uniref:Uncharacterized protein n=1 Tax=Eumeta variegata TaxID=151549 RepID=A0A4C2A3R6_EUMVA|nr:hypothetical protein EVAR_67943_1 [Eumeta japonica]
MKEIQKADAVLGRSGIATQYQWNIDDAQHLYEPYNFPLLHLIRWLQATAERNGHDIRQRFGRQVYFRETNEHEGHQSSSSPLPIDTCNHRGATSTLLVFWLGIYLTERGIS